MNLSLEQTGVSPRVFVSGTNTAETGTDAVTVLYGVFKTLRADKISRDAFTAALLSVEKKQPSSEDSSLLADPVRVAAAIFRGVVLHDRAHLPIPSQTWPPYRYGTGRTLWGSVREAAHTFAPSKCIEKRVGERATALIEELMEEGGFLPSKDANRRVRAGVNNKPAQLLSHAEIERADGSHEVVNIVKLVGDRRFTILRQIGDEDATGSEDVQEFKANTNSEIVEVLGIDAPSTLMVCQEFGILQSHLIV